MKYLSLIVALLASPAAFAQQMPPLLEVGLLNPRIPCIFKLAQHTPLYHHLRDTLTSRPARRLHPGNVVILASEAGQYRPYWLRVVRGDDTGTSYSKDTAAYYLPAYALKGAQMTVISLKNAPK
jgi:hypothetical protein